MSCKSCCRSCCRTFGYGLLVALFVFISAVVKGVDTWHFLTEQPPGCAHEELPGNQSGVKVIVAGFAKSGTRTICHALNDIGINAYHSEDFHFLPWWDFITEVRSQKWQYQRMSQSNLAHSMKGDKALAAMMMRKISRCRMEAIAFDGLEVLQEAFEEFSPDAKVILLSWRTFSAWKKSLNTFIPKLFVMCLHNWFAGSSLGLLPWLWLLRPLDKLLGRPVENVIRQGHPPITEVSGPMVWLYHQSMNHRRQYEAWEWPMTSWIPETEEEYNGFFNEVRRRIPKERLFEWDPRRHTMEELCDFLNVHPCPKKGKTPRAINTWIFELDFPVASMSVNALRFFMHWVNWKLCWGFGSLVVRCCSRCCCCKSKAHKKPD